MEQDIWGILDVLANSEGTRMGFIGPVIDTPGSQIKPAKEGDDDGKHEDANDGA